jgi:transposase
MEATAPLLTPEQRTALIARHKRERNARYADRLKTVLWRDEGVPFQEIARRLFLDPTTPSDWVQAYRQGGTDALLSDDYQPYEGKLTPSQLRQLDAYAGQHIFLDVGPLLLYVQDEFGVSFTRSGMRDLLHRLGFTYKKAALSPGKANPQAQRRFVAMLDEFMRVKAPDTPVLFMDATHPTYDAQPAYGWIRKGERVDIPTTPGRLHLNINGAVNAETHGVIVVEDERIDATSTLELLRRVEARYPDADTIYVFADNGRYYHAKVVQDWLAQSRVRLEFLPPYSPNLNLIERLWRLMCKHMRYNRCYGTFKEFRGAILEFFFRLPEEFADSLRSLLTLKFNIAPDAPGRRQVVA